MGSLGDCRTAADVVSKLKGDGALKALSLNVEMLGGNHKTVQVGIGRARWSRIEKILSSMEWVNVEALDKSGAIIGCARKEVKDLETLSFGGGESVLSSELERILKLIVKAQDLALERRDKNLEIALGANTTLITTLVDRLSSLEKGYGRNLDMAQKYAMQAAKAKFNISDDDEDGGNEIMGNLVKLWMMQQQGAIDGLAGMGGNPNGADDVED